MRYDTGYDSPNVEDRRGQRGPMRAGAGGLGLLVGLISRFGVKGGLLLFALIAGVTYFMGGRGGPTQHATLPAQKAGRDDARAFVGFVLDDLQKTWSQKLRGYRKANVVLYSDATATGCGVGEAAVGPFYCPRDERVYLDVTFFRLLGQRMGAPGDFAQAYVIAHEVGHHVQQLTGAMGKAHGASRGEQRGAGGLSVRLELQADCYAGVWARSAEQRGLLEAGDIDEAMAAAAAVGDDRLQQQATGTVRPESWTHGSSAERRRWFDTGHRTGDPDACDTFR